MSEVSADCLDDRQKFRRIALEPGSDQRAPVTDQDVHFVAVQASQIRIDKGCEGGIARSCLALCAVDRKPEGLRSLVGLMRQLQPAELQSSNLLHKDVDRLLENDCARFGRFRRYGERFAAIADNTVIEWISLCP